MNRRADGAESPTIAGFFFSSQNSAAFAGFVVGYVVLDEFEPLFCVERFISGRKRQRAGRKPAEAAPSKAFAQHEGFGHKREGHPIALGRHGAREFVFDFGFAGVCLPHEHENGKQHVQR